MRVIGEDGPNFSDDIDFYWCEKHGRFEPKDWVEKHNGKIIEDFEKPKGISCYDPRMQFMECKDLDE